MTKQQYIERMESELEELTQRISSYSMNHDGINDFISKDCKLRSMKQRRQSLINLLESLS